MNIDIHAQEHKMPGLEGLDFISTGACPGCRECGLEDLADANEDPRRYAEAEEPHTSKFPCEACHDSDEGHRHPAHGVADGEMIHLDICTVCLFAIEYPNGTGH